jgi:hypothetical protein
MYAHLQNSIEDIWPNEGEVLESASKAPVHSGITDRGTSGGDLSLCINRGGGDLSPMRQLLHFWPDPHAAM